LARVIEQRSLHLGSEWFSEAREAYEVIRTHFTETLSFDDARSGLAAYFDKMLEQIAVERTREVAQRPVSHPALARIAAWCDRALNGEPDVFPLSAFQQRTIVQDVEAEEVVFPLRHSRGAVIDPPMEDDPVNAEEFFGDVITKALMWALMERIRIQLKPKVLKAKGATGYWNHLRRQRNSIRDAGDDPILVLEDITLPGWVFDALHPIHGETAQPPKDMDTSHDPTISTDGYRANIAGVPTYTCPLLPGGSLLITRQSLESFTLSPFEDGRLVRVKTQDVVGSPEEIELLLAVRVKVRIGDRQAYRLTYPAKESFGNE
jgi:hypothetical protein